MTAKTVKDALAVPTASVFKNADGAYYVLVAGGDNKANQTLVQLGVKNAEFTQIVSGINAGDPIITSGGFAIPDGTAIRVEKAAGGEKDGAAGPPDKSSEPQSKKPSSAQESKEQE
jgi:multidrug efflux system membrane fusion protein